MLPPPDAARPSRYAYIAPVDGLTLDGGAPDLVGSLDMLKRHCNVEHAEDDAYLTTLWLSALQAVGDYTRWPMRTGPVTVSARWPWPAVRRRHIVLPGPAHVLGPRAPAVVLCEWHGGQLLPRTQLTGPHSPWPTDVQRSERLPHDAVVQLPAALEYDDDGTGELVVQYTAGWEAVYDDGLGGDAWPRELAHLVYRVAAGWYLYREPTPMAENPVRGTIMASLGPYLPVEV